MFCNQLKKKKKNQDKHTYVYINQINYLKPILIGIDIGIVIGIIIGIGIGAGILLRSC